MKTWVAGEQLSHTDLNANFDEVKNGMDVTIGETIAGATTPVPVYQSKADGKFYACDGNDLTKLKFAGFIVTSGVANDTETLKTQGFVPGFTGLTVGEKYYVQDAVGTIGTSVGTYEILVGIAVSSTTIMIQKGRRYASGVLTHDATGTTETTTITVGFRISKVHITAVSHEANIGNISQGGWTVHGGNDCVYLTVDSSGTLDTSGSSNNAVYQVANGEDFSANISNITDTSFDIVSNDGGGDFGQSVKMFWTAEGEL